jgi:hypothetical protein
MPMHPKQYFSKSKGDWPKVGVTGVESEWMPFGVDLPVPSGKLWAGDPWQVDDEQFSMDVTPGNYRVEVKGMDFKGHRRTARLRACLEDVDEPTLGNSSGTTGTDIAVVGLCDIATFEKDVRAKHLKKYEKDMEAALDAGGTGYIQFDYGRVKDGDDVGLMLLMPSGLGDGAFAVYPLRKGKRTVGMEVEFLPPGFKLERAIPRVG